METDIWYAETTNGLFQTWIASQLSRRDYESPELKRAKDVCKNFLQNEIKKCTKKYNLLMLYAMIIKY